MSKTAKRLVVLAALLLAASAFFLFDLERFLSLEGLKSSRDHYQELYARRSWAVVAAYVALYAGVVAANLPGSSILSLAGGALFGLWTGLVAASFASSLGASAGFLISRFLLRDWVERRFGDFLRRVNCGLERDGRFYLFVIRLIPAIPFFATNLVMGVTRMRLWSFYWVSQLGMLPITLIFVNAGRELSRIRSLSDAASPGLIVSVALLGLMPLAGRYAARAFHGRRSCP